MIEGKGESLKHSTIAKAVRMYLLDKSSNSDMSGVNILTSVQGSQRLVVLPNAVQCERQAVVAFVLTVIDLNAPRRVFDRLVKHSAACVGDAEET